MDMQTLSIQAILAEHLRKEYEARQKRERSGLWSPSCFGRCFRYQVWYRRAEPFSDPPDDRLLRVFACGKVFHDFIQQIILKQYPSAQIEVEARNDYILGYADMVTEDEVFDIKTVHSRAFWHFERAEKEGKLQEDKETAILQVLTYAWILQKPKARLVFVSKDDLCIAEYGFALNETWQRKLYLELKTLNDFWRSNQLPLPEPRAYGGKECRFCWYKTKCKG
jgi:hypothetical protein